MFQDGSVDTISPTSLAHGCVTFPMSPRRGYTAVACIPRRNNTEVQARLSVRLVPQSSPRYNGRVRPSEESRNNTNTLSRRPNWCWPTWAPVQRPRPPKKTQVSLASIVFPLNNFKHFLTLFSKFFASFPHGTCSLSVSRQYLALDEIYHPFCTALPSNATLRKPPVLCRRPSRRRDSHPLWCPVPKDLYPVPHRVGLSRLQFGVGTTSISNLSSSRFTRRY